MIFLMAFRNITRNSKNSLIIAFFICVMTFLFFFGNTVIGQGGRGLKSTFIDNITGDIIIEKKGDVTMSLFGANAPVIEEYFSIEPLPAYDELMKILSRRDDIAAMTSQVTCLAAASAGDVRIPAVLFGIDAGTYFRLFPGIRVEEGRLLEEGEYGIMLTREQCKGIESDSGKKMETGAPVTLTSAGNAGFKIRELPLVGIYSYNNPQDVLNKIALIDIETARVLSEIQVAGSGAEVPQEARALIGTESLDDIFEDTGDVEIAGTDGVISQELMFQPAAQPEAGRGSFNSRGGDWNFILIKLKGGVITGKVIKEINSRIEALGARAEGWRTAAGVTAILLLLVQALYNAGIFIVCVAGVIAIVNILLISVFRRTREIGTLRALGARGSYIRLLLLAENCTLGLAGGVAGIILSSVVFTLVNMLNINIGNELLAELFGGGVLHIGFYPEMALLSLALSFVLSFLSSLFPIEIAVKIEPVVAVREG